MNFLQVSWLHHHVLSAFVSMHSRKSNFASFSHHTDHFVFCYWFICCFDLLLKTWCCRTIHPELPRGGPVRTGRDDIPPPRYCLHGKYTLDHYEDTVPKIRNIKFPFPIPTFMFLWAIHILPRSVLLFCCRKKEAETWKYVNRSQIHECRNW